MGVSLPRAQSAAVNRPGSFVFRLALTATAALLLSALFSSSARALDKGVVGWLGIDVGAGCSSSTTTCDVPGSLRGPNAVAVNETGAGGVDPGTIYVVQARRIDVFDPNGSWKARWGWNVIGINEEQVVRVDAAEGSFKLTFGGKTTASIPINATAAAVQTALSQLESIGAGNVTVQSSTGSKTWRVIFQGILDGTDVEQIQIDGSGLVGPNEVDGGPPTSTVETTVDGAGGNAHVYEICTVGDLCTDGEQAPTPAPNGGFSGSFDGARGISIDQGDGSVYVTDRGFNRVQKFDAVGNPILVYGKDVNLTQAGTAFEICTVESGDTCQAGAQGTAGGEFSRPGSSVGNGLAVVPSGAPNAGNVVVGDSQNRRIHEFTGSGEWVRTFGWDVLPNASPDNLPNNEVQEVKIPADSGTFTLSFNNQTTPALPFDASAESVENALNALSSVSSGGGSVSVTGGPGDANGSSPYEVTFDGGPRADVDVGQIVANGRGLGVAEGYTVTCTGPTADKTEYQWLRNGEPIEGATGSSYEITAADAGAAIQCQTFAFLDEATAGPGRGSTQASVPVMNATPLPATPRPAPPSSLPEITGTFLPGQSNQVGGDGGYTLHCHTGTWGNSPTSFKYQWYRSGVPLETSTSNTPNYVVQPADLKTPAIFQCAVTATNAAGSVTLITGQPAFGGPARTSPAAQSPQPPTPTAQVTDLAEVRTTVTGASFEVCTTAPECRAGVAGESPGQFPNSNPPRIAVDSTGAIYAVRGSGNSVRVEKLTPQAGPPGLAPSIFGSSEPDPPGFPNTNTNDYAILSIAVGKDDRVLVEKESATGHTPVCFDGSPSVFERRVQEFEPDGTHVGTHGICAGISNSSSDRGVTENQSTGDVYLLDEADRVMILNAGGGTDPAVELDQPVPTATTASLTGTVNPNPTPPVYPNPPDTFWKVQYKRSVDSEWIDFGKPANVGHGSGDVPFKKTVIKLLPNTSYDVRVVATKEFNATQTIGSPRTFKTDPAPPAILAARTTGVLEHSAVLNATIDPRGSDTEAYFEWGPTQAYGNVTPKAPVGSEHGGFPASAQITGLQSQTYHFRVVAENEAGKVVSENQTFTFHPPPCPNSLVRQQTEAAYLPDCRAYELVSPPDAGNTVINSFSGLTSPYATSPSRLSYVGMFAPLPVDADPPNTQDLYMSTRTNSGWVVDHIGFPATETFFVGGHPGPLGTAGYWYKGAQVSPLMDRIMLWDLGNPEVQPPSFSNAPYIFGPDGEVIERWPTNVTSVPNGTQFRAQVYELLASPELKHFYFSSHIPFLPGAPPEAIYHNDAEAGTLEIVSKDPNGADFSGYPVKASEDGSRLLMAKGKPPFCSDLPCTLPPFELYMREGNQTRDVTKGHKVTFSGMTKDGSKVYFLSEEAVVPGEADGGTDLFMWSAEADAVIKVSAGEGGAGDTDDCAPVDGWTEGCSVKPIFRYQQECGGYTGIHDNCGPDSPRPNFANGYFNYQTGARGGHPGDDSFLAEDSGDIYFYSPEKLDGPEKGAEGLPNLYVFRDGDVQFVAILDTEAVCRSEEGIGSDGPYCAEGPIGRMQVTPDGDYAAFSATTRLTGYDNKGFEEIYRYNTDNDVLICVSCRPDGEPPTGPVDGSQNGRFITDDGRVFFSTSDALQPNDTNEAQDVYEYVGGRPQLITAGTGTTREPLCPSCGLGQFSRTGLIAVSADGQDVYFGTHDVLVPQDHNGGNLKIYDARVNGGFPTSAAPAPCQAADECHAGSSPQPPPLVGGTESRLGQSGNVATPNRAKRRAAKRRAAKRRAARRKRRAAQRRRARQRRRALKRKRSHLRGAARQGRRRDG